MVVCDALAETEMNTLPHTEVFICELDKGHEGKHRATVEWEGGEWISASRARAKSRQNAVKT